MDPIIENRRIYEVDKRFFMVLTINELNRWINEAPEKINYIEGEACFEIFIVRNGLGINKS